MSTFRIQLETQNRFGAISIFEWGWLRVVLLINLASLQMCDLFHAESPFSKQNRMEDDRRILRKNNIPQGNMQ